MRSESWPYPSYADRRWLGGERGSDPALAAVVHAVRSTASAGGDMVSEQPDSLLAGLAHVTSIAERVEWATLSLVGEARARGASWVAIGNALGVSKQAAQQRFAPYVKQALAQARRPAER